MNQRAASAPVAAHQELGELARLVLCPRCGKYLIKSTWGRKYKKDNIYPIYSKHYLICQRDIKYMHEECYYHWCYEDILVNLKTYPYPINF
jgi:hypothetical protein